MIKCWNWEIIICYYSIAKSNSLWRHGLQHARLLCPSLSPGICSDSCPLSFWCHPTVLSSAAPFSSSPQSFPASGSFPMSWLFAIGGQSIEASASVLPMNIQGWHPLGLTGLRILIIYILKNTSSLFRLLHFSSLVNVYSCLLEEFHSSDFSENWAPVHHVLFI